MKKQKEMMPKGESAFDRLTENIFFFIKHPIYGNNCYIKIQDTVYQIKNTRLSKDAEKYLETIPASHVSTHGHNVEG